MSIPQWCCGTCGAVGRGLVSGIVEMGLVWLGEGGGANRENCTIARNKRYTGDAPANQPVVAGVFPQ